MTKIYLVRHAEAEGNIYRRFHGWYNSLITENGYRQIAALEKRFEGVQIDAVYSSDLFRTMTTAGAVYKSRGLELHTDPALREIGGGVWEDRPWAELNRENRESLERFNVADFTWKVEGSETHGEVQARVCAALLRIAAAHDGQTVAVFSHGTAIRLAIAKFSGLPPEQINQISHGDNTCVACLEVTDGQVDIRFFNDNSHLGELSTLAKQSWWKKKGMEDYDKVNMWYRPMDMDTEGEIYYQARKEAWITIHGTLDGFNGDGFLADARRQSERDNRSVMCAMLGDELAGVLQMDFLRDADRGVGGIPFYYLTPETRTKGLGVQLMGQAVSIYRSLGRDKLRLRCAPENSIAQHFYHKHGFVKVDEEPGGCGTLDVLEKYIGYEERT